MAKTKTTAADAAETSKPVMGILDTGAPLKPVEVLDVKVGVADLTDVMVGQINDVLLEQEKTLEEALAEAKGRHNALAAEKELVSATMLARVAATMRNNLAKRLEAWNAFVLPPDKLTISEQGLEPLQVAATAEGRVKAPYFVVDVAWSGRCEHRTGLLDIREKFQVPAGTEDLEDLRKVKDLEERALSVGGEIEALREKLATAKTERMNGKVRAQAQRLIVGQIVARIDESTARLLSESAQGLAQEVVKKLALTVG